MERSALQWGKIKTAAVPHGSSLCTTPIRSSSSWKLEPRNGQPSFTTSPFALCSRNEELEEIASADLKYLMVPAFQGSLTLKQVNPSKRLEHLFEAREHFLNYLTQCQNYHVADFELPLPKRNLDENNTPSSSMAYPNLVTMASQRQAKIERWVNGYKLRSTSCRYSAFCCREPCWYFGS